MKLTIHNSHRKLKMTREENYWVIDYYYFDNYAIDMVYGYFTKIFPSIEVKASKTGPEEIMSFKNMIISFNDLAEETEFLLRFDTFEISL